MTITLVSLDQIGNQLKLVRKVKGLNQHEASDKLGMSPATLSFIENGKSVSLERLADFEVTYGIKMNIAISMDPDDFKRLQQLNDKEAK